MLLPEFRRFPRPPACCLFPFKLGDKDHGPVAGKILSLEADFKLTNHLGSHCLFIVLGPLLMDVSFCRKLAPTHSAGEGSAQVCSCTCREYNLEIK